MAGKNQIRAEAARLRNHFPEAFQKEESRKLNRLLISWIARCEQNRFYVYAPLGSEVDIRETISFLLDEGKRVAFPKVKGKDMCFIEVKDMDRELSEGCFHVMEPGDKPPVDWQDAAVLVPGLAFDRSGNRIGYGKGYYDRYFADHSCSCLIGITYRELLYEKGYIPADAFDRNMDAVCTPEEIIKIKKSGGREIWN